MSTVDENDTGIVTEKLFVLLCDRILKSSRPHVGLKQNTGQYMTKLLIIISQKKKILIIMSFCVL